MKGNNLFGNSKTNKTSGNFISNKKDKTIYTNIINNDFQNIENTSFKSSQDLKNDSIFLKSIGGFNVSSQSARIDLARGRSLSESFNYKNKII